MDCEKREAVQDYLDGQLEPREAAAMAAHLRECPACAREAEESAALDAALRGLPRPDPGPEFAAAIMRQVRRSPAPRSGFSLSPWEALLLALLYGVLAALLVPASGWLARVEDYQAVLNALRLLAAGALSLRSALVVANPWGWTAAIPAATGGAAALGAAAVLALLYRGAARPAGRRPLGGRL